MIMLAQSQNEPAFLTIPSTADLRILQIVAEQTMHILTNNI